MNLLKDYRAESFPQIRARYIVTDVLAVYASPRSSPSDEDHVYIRIDSDGCYFEQKTHADSEWLTWHQAFIWYGAELIASMRDQTHLLEWHPFATKRRRK